MMVEASRIPNITPDDEVNWNVVNLVVKGYADRYPEEILGVVELIKKHRAALKTKFAEVGNESNARHMYEMPEKLRIGLEMKYPKLFKGNNLKKFLNTYTLFRIPEKL